jgi:Sec-independent protein translocase protein TatA
MNGPGILELVVIIFLLWVLLGPQKVMEGARVLGKAYRQFRGYGTNLGSGKVTEKERVRASAERLGIDTSGMDIEEIKLVMVEKLSKE